MAFHDVRLVQNSILTRHSTSATAELKLHQTALRLLGSSLLPNDIDGLGH